MSVSDTSLNLQQCSEPIASFASLRAAVLRSCDAPRLSGAPAAVALLRKEPRRAGGESILGIRWFNCLPLSCPLNSGRSERRRQWARRGGTGTWLRRWLWVGGGISLLGGLLWLLVEHDLGLHALVRSAGWAIVAWVGCGLIWIGLQY